MAKSQNKTVETDANVGEFIDSVEHDQKRADSHEVLQMMREITGQEPKMWGASLVGFGSYHYRYASGREGDFFLTGFSPRKQALTVYIMPGFASFDDLMSKLGKYKTGKSCLYIKKLDDIDRDCLRELIEQSVLYMRETYETN